MTVSNTPANLDFLDRQSEFEPDYDERGIFDEDVYLQQRREEFRDKIMHALFADGSRAYAPAITISID